MVELTADPPPEESMAVLPFLFVDGDRSVDMGTVNVHPAVGFKKFQATIAQRIGVAPHQISAALVRRRKARSPPDARRRVPIDESTDFAAIARETEDCYVLALLRTSRRERRGRSRRGRGGEFGGKAAAVAEEGRKKAAPEKTILRRIPYTPAPAAIGEIGLWDYESQMRNLQQQRERYLLSTAMPYYPHTAPAAGAAEAGLWDARRGAEAQPPATACEECEAAASEGRRAGFHRCVRDPVVTARFRSPVGPIERPPKKRVEATA